MALNDDELRAVLSRAAEIQHASRGPGPFELERMLDQAEAAGYSRSAVERALRERYAAPQPPQVGELAFALSTDGKYYAARVLSHAGHASRVRFLMGAELDVATDQIRPFLTPGERVWCDWPMWGTWMCTVQSYDAVNSKVKLSDRWGSTKWFPIAEVWIQPPVAGSGWGGLGVYISILGAGALIGGIVGSVVTAALIR